MKDDQRKAIFAQIHKKTGKSLKSTDLTAYDVKARKKVDIDNPRLTELANGRMAIRGESSLTGLKVFRII